MESEEIDEEEERFFRKLEEGIYIYNYKK